MSEHPRSAGLVQSIFFRQCDVNKADSTVLRHGGPCIAWDRVALVVVGLGAFVGMIGMAMGVVAF